MADSPVILLFAPQPLQLKSVTPAIYPTETREMDCRHYSGDQDLNEILASVRPDVIVSFGNKNSYKNLQNSPYGVLERWLHFDSFPSSEGELESIGAMVFGFFIHRALDNKKEIIKYEEMPLVSVFTPIHRTGKRIIHRTYNSLLNQTYDRWEWVIVDDSDDNGETLKILKEIASAEPRILIHTAHRKSGKIGEVKRWAASLSQGKVLVELDHDDLLTPNALKDLVKAFRENPNVGFVYSDWADVDDKTGESLTYPEGWSLGYGSYRKEIYNEKELYVAQAPPVNSQTIRYIVGVPNHVRAWKSDAYWQAGGHNPNLAVMEDYDLVIRTFLQTQMLHIPKFCYIQYFTGKNTHRLRMSELLRLAQYISAYYEPQIRKRIEELGLNDEVYYKQADKLSA